MKDALDDMSKSAEHSRAGKGQSNKGSVKVKEDDVKNLYK